MNAPVSPQEWYEAGVLLRKEERFGEASNAFARAAELADEEISDIRDSMAHGTAPSGDDSPYVISSQERLGKITELEKIRAASLAFIELIREISLFANTDLMNP